MSMPLPAAIGTFIGAFLGYPVLGYVAGMKIAGVAPPVYGSGFAGEVAWNNVENFGGISTLPGAPAERAPRYRSTCRQCGAPHEAKASACGYCLSPMDGAPAVEMVEVTTMGDRERRYVPATQPAPLFR
jgi:hypothetical protein